MCGIVGNLVDWYVSKVCLKRVCWIGLPYKHHPQKLKKSSSFTYISSSLNIKAVFGLFYVALTKIGSISPWFAYFLFLPNTLQKRSSFIHSFEIHKNLKLETIYTFIFQQVNFNSLHISWFQQTLCKRGHHSYTPTFRQTNINSLFWNPLNGNLNLETIYTSIFHQQNLEFALLNPNLWLFYTLFWKMFRGKRKSARRILR